MSTQLVPSKTQYLADLAAKADKKRTLISSLYSGKIATSTAPPTSSQAFNPFFNRVGFVNGPVAISDVRLFFAQWQESSLNGDILIGNDGTYKVAIEYNGTTYPVFWPDGARSKTIVDGAGAWTAPCGVDIPAGATFFVRVYFTGAKFPRGDVGTVAGTSFDSSSTDQTDATGAANTSLVGGNVLMPTLITGTPWSAPTTVVIVGDSIAKGTGDTAVANRGYIRYALGSAYPNLSIAMPGDLASVYVASAMKRRALIAGADIAIEEYGNNDLAAGAANVTLQASRLAIWQGLAARGCRVFATTVTPRTTSTDSWATVANQTSANAGIEAIRVAHNTWLRAGAPLDPTTLTPVTVGTAGAVKCNVYNPSTGALSVTASGTGHPLYGVFDPTLLAESAQDSGKWVANSTADGIHPNSTTVATMAGSIRTAAFTS